MTPLIPDVSVSRSQINLILTNIIICRINRYRTLRYHREDHVPTRADAYPSSHEGEDSFRRHFLSCPANLTVSMNPPRVREASPKKMRATQLVVVDPAIPSVVCSFVAQSSCTDDVNYQDITMDCICTVEQIDGFKSYLSTIPFAFTNTCPTVAGRMLPTSCGFARRLVKSIYPRSTALALCLAR